MIISLTIFVRGLCEFQCT